MKTDYSYQTKAAKQVLKKAMEKKYSAAVLAAAPGAGKTTISHHIINNYVRLFPHAKIVVITQGQNILRQQYLKELSNANIPINFSFGDVESQAQVKVCIAQNLDLIHEADLLIVDEAHNYFFAKQIQGFIRRTNPKHLVLMSGTPSIFVRKNKEAGYNKYYIHAIAAEELSQNNVFSGVDMDVIQIEDNNPSNMIKDVIKIAQKRGDNLSKIMIACPSISFAKQVAMQLTSMGRKCSVSTSTNDKDSLEIANFKSGKTDILIVVGRGILGFNDSEITCLFDFRSSSNVDASYQLFARVLRRHPKGLRKVYYRISNRKNYNKQVLMLHKIVALMKSDIFAGFNGSNLKMVI